MTKYLGLLSLFILLLGRLNGEETKPLVLGTWSEDRSVMSVSSLALLVSPEKYDGKKIAT